MKWTGQPGRRFASLPPRSQSAGTPGTANVTVKGKSPWGDFKKSSWFDETDARRHATLYYDADADAEAYLDKGEMLPTVMEWLKSKNNLIDGEENPNEIYLRVARVEVFGETNDRDVLEKNLEVLKSALN